MKKNENIMQLRATNIVLVIILTVFIFLFIYIAFLNAIITESQYTGKQDIKVILIFSIILGGILIFIIKGGLDMYHTRFMEIHKDKIVVNKKVGKLKEDTNCLEGKMETKIDEFQLSDIKSIGYGRQLEFHQGKTSYQIKGYEIVFVLKNGEKITIDISWFPKKKMKRFFLYIYQKIQLLPVEKLRNDFGLTIGGNDDAHQ
ncbi:MAG: hypothetical protein RR799_09580 [Lachnospiraceae bacterium]